MDELVIMRDVKREDLGAPGTGIRQTGTKLARSRTPRTPSWTARSSPGCPDMSRFTLRRFVGRLVFRAEVGRLIKGRKTEYALNAK